MKNLMKNAFMMLLLIVSAVSAYAGKPKTPAERADFWISKMTQPLALKPDQATQIKELIIKKETRRDEEKIKFANDKESAKRAAQIRQREFNANLKKVLTAEQYTKLDQIRKEMREKRKANQATKNGGTGPTPAKEEQIPLDDEPDNE